MEENPEDGTHWKRGINEPFQGHKEKFAAIPKSARSDFIKQMLKKEQIQSLPTYQYKTPFPSESTFKYLSYDLNYYSLTNTSNSKAILIIVHGVNSNGSVFGYLASKIAEKNKELNVYSFDQMNFGKSKGNMRGLVVSLDDTVNQLEAFVDFILERFKAKPKIYLCGMSYGGAVSFKATIKRPQRYAGVIFLSPAFKDIEESVYYGKRIVSLLGWVMPRLKINFSVPSGFATKYNMSEIAKDDPLVVNDCIVPATVRSMLNAVADVSQLFSKFTLPFLCVASGVEKVVGPFAVLDFQEESPSKDKTVIYAENMWHALMYEQEIVGVSWHCAEWLKERI